MKAQRGWILVLSSRKVGMPEHRGTIEEVLPESEGHPQFVVRWDDGRRSSIRPTGAYRVLPPQKGKAR